MRKLKLLFAALALFVGVGSANAYTVDDLTSAGWTKVTTSPITNVNDNYFMLVDCNSSNYVMANQADHFRPCYKTIADPVDNPSFVWILEGSDNEFALKSYSTGAYFKQATGWNTSVGYARDSRTKVTGVFEISGGKYTLKCKESGKYVGHWNDGGAAVASDGENIAANKAIENAPGFYLYSISRATFDAALAASRLAAVSTATKASPASVTSYIQNADWSGDWGGWESSFTSSGNMQWGQQTLESWNASNVIIKQELRGIPNGTYKLTADLISGNSDNKVAYVFATGDTKVSSDAVSAEASAGNYNTMSSEVAGKTLTADNVVVTGNTITVGIDQSSGWIVADNFTLSYYGPNLAVSAALPAGDMTADTWYYFDIAIDGVYNLSYTNLSDIVYATDGSILVEDAASITTNFTGSSVNLTSGRYYVKSSSAQTLGVAPASYSYHVGTPTSSISDGSYLQSLTTVTFTLGDAASNDGTATLALQGTPVAKLNDGTSDVADGALTISGNVVTATYTSVTLDPAKTYTITLPANTVAWDKNTENKNTAKVITFKTPAVFDGVYYMYNTDTKNYISRAGNYNTQAIMDNYGLAFNVSTDTENNTKLQYFDSELWLGDDGSCYGDCTSTRIRTYNITKVAEGYKFLNTNNSKYLAVNNGQTVGDAVEGDNLQGTSNIWNLESTAAHVANYTTNANKQATDVATAASLAGITTKAALDTELEANYIAIPVTVTGAKAEKYQVYPGNSKDSGPVAYHSETVNLTPGLYKLSVDAFQRATTNEKVFAADGARGLICLYAGAVKTQIKSVSEYGSNSQYASTDYADNGKYYPNREATGYQALETGNYKNEVYFYVAETSDVEIGIQNASRPGNNCGTWSIYNNWTLTRYISASTTESVTVTPAGYATYVSTLPLDYTSTEIKAYTAKANDGKIVLTQINKVPANTPVVLYKEGGATEAIPVATTTDTPAASDLVAGTGAAVATAEGDYTNYILNVGTKGIGFYRANSQTVEANRAYMHVSNSETGSMSRMAIVFDNQTTGIANLKAAADGDDAIYNLNGQRIEKATKGIYIIDGKKMIMK